MYLFFINYNFKIQAENCHGCLEFLFYPFAFLNILDGRSTLVEVHGFVRGLTRGFGSTTKKLVK